MTYVNPILAQNNKNYIFSLLTVSVISQLILLSFPSLFNDNTTSLLTTGTYGQNINSNSDSVLIRGGVTVPSRVLMALQTKQL